MINVICSHDNFIYDVHSLVKAFYPGENIKVITKEKMEFNLELPERYPFNIFK